MSARFLCYKPPKSEAFENSRVQLAQSDKLLAAR
jgi:hypothetical protein